LWLGIRLIWMSHEHPHTWIRHTVTRHPQHINVCPTLSHINKSYMNKSWTVPPINESRTFPHINESRTFPHMNECSTLPHINKSHKNKSWTVPPINESRTFPNMNECPTLPHINKSHTNKSWTVPPINESRTFPHMKECPTLPHMNGLLLRRRLRWLGDLARLSIQVLRTLPHEWMSHELSHIWMSQICETPTIPHMNKTLPASPFRCHELSHMNEWVTNSPTYEWVKYVRHQLSHIWLSHEVFHVWMSHQLFHISMSHELSHISISHTVNQHSPQMMSYELFHISMSHELSHVSISHTVNQRWPHMNESPTVAHMHEHTCMNCSTCRWVTNFPTYQ